MEKEVLLKEIQDVIAEVELINGGKTELAKKIDVSPAIITQIGKGEYNLTEGNVVYNKIARYLELRDKKNTFREITFVETSISKRILGIMEYCQMQHIICTIHGIAGVGKTITAERYVEKNPSAIKIDLIPGTCGGKGLLEEICEALKINSDGKERKLFKRIVEKLKGSNKMIIIDEAQGLKKDAIEYIKSIYDAAKVAIILIGNKGIYEKIAGDQSERDSRMCSRAFMNCELSKNDILYDDIKLVFEGLDEDAIKYLYKIVKKSNWGIRGATGVYINAMANGDISEDGLMGTTRMMGIEVK